MENTATSAPLVSDQVNWKFLEALIQEYDLANITSWMEAEPHLSSGVSSLIQKAIGKFALLFDGITEDQAGQVYGEMHKLAAFVYGAVRQGGMDLCSQITGIENPGAAAESTEA